MAYKDNPQIEESDSCTVVLRGGVTLRGHMRRWDRFYRPPASQSTNEGPVLVWCLLADNGKGGTRRVTWTRDGNYRTAGASRFDIVDFQIGRSIT